MREGLSVRDLEVTYRVRQGRFGAAIPLRAVRGVSFDVGPGQTFGIVGESGCGKSSLARALIGLAPVSGGEVIWNGRRISGLSPKAFLPVRRDIQMLFQDPLASINPRMSVEEVIAEPLRTHDPRLSGAERHARVVEALDKVALSRDFLGRFRHELSGGQAQRVGIARAIVVRPRLLICDEAVSALDVSVQALILTLLRELQAEMGLGIVFISHDLGVVNAIAHDMAVLYLGQVMEIGASAEVLRAPRHPYSARLLSAVLEPADAAARVDAASDDVGELPSPLYPPTGCPYHTRCGRADATCRKQPPLVGFGAAHKAACHHPLGGKVAA